MADSGTNAPRYTCNVLILPDSTLILQLFSAFGFSVVNKENSFRTKQNIVLSWKKLRGGL